jgi:hypothetical protein
MVALGFSAEKAHSLARNFFLKTMEISFEGSIQFHELHPSNKIPFYWARRYRMRLTRACGWSGNLFTLAYQRAMRPKALTLLHLNCFQV